MKKILPSKFESKIASKGLKRKRRIAMKKYSDFHQKLMDEAYDKWQKNKEWGYSDFINNLDDLHRKAVLIGNMNYQVENGGWSQWYDNGYAEYAEEVLDILEEFSEDYPDIGEKVLDIVKEAVSVIYEGDESLETYLELDSAYRNGYIEDVISRLYYMHLIDFRDMHEAMERFLEEEWEGEIEDTESCEEDDECYSRFEEWLDGEISDVLEDIERMVYSRLDKLNRRYYEINEEFMEKFNEWLKEKASPYARFDYEGEAPFSKFESKIASELLNIAEELIKEAIDKKHQKRRWKAKDRLRRVR